MFRSDVHESHCSWNKSILFFHFILLLFLFDIVVFDTTRQNYVYTSKMRRIRLGNNNDSNSMVILKFSR